MTTANRPRKSAPARYRSFALALRVSTPPPPEGVVDGQVVVGGVQYYASWAVITAAAVGAVVFRMWSLLIGVAVGLPYAGLQRRRRVSRK